MSTLRFQRILSVLSWHTAQSWESILQRQALKSRLQAEKILGRCQEFTLIQFNSILFE